MIEEVHRLENCDHEGCKTVRKKHKSPALRKLEVEQGVAHRLGQEQIEEGEARSKNGEQYIGSVIKHIGEKNKSEAHKKAKKLIEMRRELHGK